MSLALWIIMIGFSLVGVLALFAVAAGRRQGDALETIVGPADLDDSRRRWEAAERLAAQAEFDKSLDWRD
jgi:hypothetical protein